MTTEALFHCNLSFGSVGGGQSAKEKLDYILREGEHRASHDDLGDSGHGNLPAWSNGNPRVYFDAADKQGRVNGALFREVEVAIPASFDNEQMRDLIDRFLAELTKLPGGSLPYVWGKHINPGNPHLHIELATQINDGVERDAKTWFRNRARKGKPPESGGAPKWKLDAAESRAWALATRALWQHHVNEAFERHGIDSRVDCRSYNDRGLLKLPTKHEGWPPRQPSLNAPAADRAYYAQRLQERQAIVAYNEVVRTFNRVVAEFEADPESAPVTLAELEELRAQIEADAPKRSRKGGGFKRLVDDANHDDADFDDIETGDEQLIDDVNETAPIIDSEIVVVQDVEHQAVVQPPVPDRPSDIVLSLDDQADLVAQSAAERAQRVSASPVASAEPIEREHETPSFSTGAAWQNPPAAPAHESRADRPTNKRRPPRSDRLKETFPDVAQEFSRFDDEYTPEARKRDEKKRRDTRQVLADDWNGTRLSGQGKRSVYIDDQLIPNFARKTIASGVEIYMQMPNDEIAFVVRDTEIRMKMLDQSSVEAALRVALKAWPTVEVKGSLEEQRQFVQAALAMGMYHRLGKVPLALVAEFAEEITRAKASASPPRIAPRDLTSTSTAEAQPAPVQGPPHAPSMSASLTRPEAPPASKWDDEDDRAGLARMLRIEREQLDANLTQMGPKNAPADSDHLEGEHPYPRPIAGNSKSLTNPPFMAKELRPDVTLYLRMPDDTQAFVARPDSIRLTQPANDPEAIAAALRLALSKWERVVARGSVEFQTKVLEEARRMGLEHRVSTADESIREKLQIPPARPEAVDVKQTLAHSAWRARQHHADRLAPPTTPEAFELEMGALKTALAGQGVTLGDPAADRFSLAFHIRSRTRAELEYMAQWGAQGNDLLRPMTDRIRAIAQRMLMADTKLPTEVRFNVQKFVAQQAAAELERRDAQLDAQHPQHTPLTAAQSDRAVQAMAQPEPAAQQAAPAPAAENPPPDDASSDDTSHSRERQGL